MNAETIIQQIERARDARGLSLRALAERAGVSHPNLCNALNGKRGMMVETLVRVADALGLDVRLVEREEKSEC